MSDPERVLNMANNLIRYAQQEAREGAHLNAILVLKQAIKDINKKIEEKCIGH